VILRESFRRSPAQSSEPPRLGRPLAETLHQKQGIEEKLTSHVQHPLPLPPRDLAER
jgi:hypothetical protein